MKIRDAFSDAGAWIVDVHFFSGVQTVFSFEAAADTLEPLARALTEAGLRFDDASVELIKEAARATVEAHGTLAVVFKRGDPNLRHEVPAVPG